MAFITSEQRIISWIKIFYYRYHAYTQDGDLQLKSTWEEQPTHNDPTKCERTSLTLSMENKKGDENFRTIIVYCTTGIIQIQGRSLREWGDNEFITIKELIDQDKEISTSAASINLQNFIDTITQSSTKKMKVSRATKSTEIPPQVTSSPIVTSSPTESASPPREQSLSTMKNVANLEASFVSFKQDVLKSFDQIKETLKTKDHEIEELKKKIASLEALNQLLQKENEHKQQQLEKKISNVITRC